MNALQQGDIFLVRWDPSIGHEFQKTRPGIIISSHEILRKSNLVTVMAITKNLGNHLPDDIVIPKTNTNRLMDDSIIKVYHISSFDHLRLVHFIGEAEADILHQIKVYLKKHFDL